MCNNTHTNKHKLKYFSPTRTNVSEFSLQTYTHNPFPPTHNLFPQTHNPFPQTHNFFPQTQTSQKTKIFHKQTVPTKNSHKTHTKIPHNPHTTLTQLPHNPHTTPKQPSQKSTPLTNINLAAGGQQAHRVWTGPGDDDAEAGGVEGPGQLRLHPQHLRTSSCHLQQCPPLRRKWVGVERLKRC